MRVLLRMVWAWLMMAPEARAEIANVAAAFCAEYPAPAYGWSVRAMALGRRALGWAAPITALARKGALFCGLRRRLN